MPVILASLAHFFKKWLSDPDCGVRRTRMFRRNLIRQLESEARTTVLLLFFLSIRVISAVSIVMSYFSSLRNNVYNWNGE